MLYYTVKIPLKLELIDHVYKSVNPLSPDHLMCMDLLFWAPWLPEYIHFHTAGGIPSSQVQRIKFSKQCFSNLCVCFCFFLMNRLWKNLLFFFSFLTHFILDHLKPFFFFSFLFKHTSIYLISVYIKSIHLFIFTYQTFSYINLNQVPLLFALSYMQNTC